MSHHPAYARNAPADELSHLRSQNEQLWRIIEKQRVMIQNLQKDNARLAAERDGLADKLQGLSKQRQRTASILISPEMLREIAEADDGSSELSPVPTSSPVPPPRSPFRQAKSDEAVPQQQQRSTAAAARRARVRESMMPPPRGALEHDPMMRAASPPLPRRPPTVPPLGSPRPEQQQDILASPVPTIQEPTPAATNDATATQQLSLGNICVNVVASNIKTNERGKEVIAFIISVCRKGSDEQKLEELWRVEKLYSDFLDLDTKLKTQHHHTITSRIAKLPDKALFTTHAPSKVDQRKLALEQYLQHAISLPWDDMSTLCEFLSTNVIEHDVYQATGSKQGYLTKRGKNFGGWKTRYFVLNDDVIDYYESKDGSHLGTIRLTNAQIGRQTSNVTPNVDDTTSVYRHAFLLVEQKRAGSSHVVRHILCADSDKERDEWVEAILQNIRFDDDSSVDAYKVDKNSKRSKKVAKPAATPAANPQQAAPPPPPPPVPAVMEPTDSVGLSISSNTVAMGPTPSVSSDSTNSSLLSSSLPSTVEGRESLEQFRNRNLQTPPPIMVRRSSMINLSTTEEEPLPPRSVSPGPGRHSEELPDEVAEKKTKNKTNRMTIWGKKVFGSDSSSSSSPPRPSTSLSATTASSDTSSSLKTTSTSSGLRSFLSRSSNESTDRPVVNSKQVFGVPLEEAVRISRVVEGYELPSVVYRCIEYLDAKNAVMEEGLYRLSGSAAVIKSLKQKFNKDGDVNLLAAKEEYDVHAIAGLLKMWLRELPTSVLTRERRMDFLHVIDLLDRKDRVNELGRLVSQLPLANYTLLRALTAHLIRVVQHSDINKMTVRNVSIVFSPTLGIPAMVFNLFMSEFEYIFWTTEDGDAAPRMIEEPSIPPEAQSQQDLEQKQQQQSSEEKSSEQGQQPQDNKSKLTRKPTLTLREECGRSNRNSVNYIDGAPNAIVQLELNMEGPLVLEEDEDEVDELTLSASNHDDQNQHFTYQQQQQQPPQHQQ